MTLTPEQVAELVAALESLLELCYHGDFKNGVTDTTNMIDEGDVIASERIDHARTLLVRLAQNGKTS